MKKSKKLTRRDFLRLSAITTAGLALWSMPGWLQAAAALSPSSRRKTLVVLFQRGAADGLNIVAPFVDPLYQKARPTIALGEPGSSNGVLDLDGHFGLHPHLSPLMPLWKNRQMAIVHSAGSPDGSRSHFDAQDNMETGTPGISTTPDGWLNRALRTFHEKSPNPLSAVALTNRLPRILRGDYPVAAMNSANSYDISMGSNSADDLESLYGGSMDSLLAAAGRQTGESLKRVKDLLKNAPAKSPFAQYTQSEFGQRFADLAKLIKAEAGLKVGFLDVGGWDHHYEEGSVNGYMGYVLNDFGPNLGAFFTDLGDKARDVVLVSMTEFGRTLNENGAHGTDHGHGSVMFLIGASVKGGKVYGKWPGLEPESLFEGRDLQVTTDFRQVYSEALAKHLGVEQLTGVFPSYKSSSHLGFL